MSGFRDTFTKGERENILGYDDSAALYFGGCVLFCVASVWTYYFVRSIVFPSQLRNLASLQRKKDNGVRQCACAFCAANRCKQVKSLSRWYPRLANARCLLQALALAGLWYAFGCIAVSLSQARHIQVFDPFEILEISSSATITEIRKAYRQLSRIHHPDKNQNDPSSSARFILITKAYQALTDEVAKNNYAKYGNPDGPTALKIGIGLPQFLVTSQHQLLILLFFFLILLVVIPAVFIMYYQHQKRYLPNGLRIESAQFIACFLKEGTRAKSLPEFLAASAESREQTALRPSDNTEMKPIVDAVSDSGKRQHCTTPIVLRNYHLILAHLQNKNHLLSDQLMDDLNTLLRASELVTQCMAELAFFRGWLNTLQSVIEFRRRLVQGVDVAGVAAPFLQIPHFDETTVKHCLKGRKAVRDFKAFVKQDPCERKGMLMMTPEQIEDITAFCLHVPLLRLSATASVADEETIVEGDVVSVTVSLTRENLRDDRETVGFVHAPRFPVLRQEAWWLLVYEKLSGALVAFTRSKNPGRSWVERLQFEAPKKGKWTYHCLAMSDDYVGLDTLTDVTITVSAPYEVRRELYVHPDDEALDLAPTLFQQMLGQSNEAGHSSDEEEDDDRRHDKNDVGTRPCNKSNSESTSSQDTSDDEDTTS